MMFKRMTVSKQNASMETRRLLSLSLPFRLDSFTSRQLLSVKDQTTRDALTMNSTTAVNNETSSGELVDDARPAKFNLTPSDLTRSEKIRGGGRIVIHVLMSCYCFLMLAIICDEYFIGSIEILCSRKTLSIFCFRKQI